MPVSSFEQSLGPGRSLTEAAEKDEVVNKVASGQ